MIWMMLKHLLLLQLKRVLVISADCTPGAAYVFCGTCLQGMYSTGGNSGGLAADTECKLCPGGTTAGPGAFTLANCSGKKYT
jgi:hypothetical protein